MALSYTKPVYKPAMHFNEKELQAVGVMVATLAEIEREDFIGVILKTGAFRCMRDAHEKDTQVVDLAHKLEEAYERARQAQPKMANLWPPLRPEQAEMPEVTAFACGGKGCPEGGEHQWDGPDVERDNCISASCSKCGMAAIDFDLMNGP